ncbi:MAG: hypothetical protein LC803_08860 [Acidobacteria bacterium]|nr:hypothetical protein [Acidobacteriota bacterium]
MWSSWIERAAEDYAPLAWTLQAKRIRFADNIPLQADERITLGLAMMAVRSQVRIAFEHPFPSARMALAAATGALLADHISPFPGDMIRGELVVVTRQTGLALQDLRDIRVEGVDIFHDVWKVDRASNAEPSAGRGRPKVYVAPPRPGNMFPSTIRTGAVVIDASHPLTLERLSDLLADPVIAQAPIQIVIMPLAYEFGSVSFTGWLRWDWDFQSISSAKSLWDGGDDQLHPCVWRRKLLVCYSDETDNALERVRLKLNALSRTVASRPPLPLLQAWGLYHRLSNLTVPLGIYEQHASNHYYTKPLKEHINDLSSVRPGDDKRGAVGAMFSSEWRPLVDCLVAAYESLKGGEPAKFWGVATAVEEYAQGNFQRPLVITCPTELEGKILVRELTHICTDLHKHLHPGGLTVATNRSVAYQNWLRAGNILMTGPQTTRWRFLDAAMQTGSVLVYPHEIAIERAIVQAVLDRIVLNSSEQVRLKVLKTLGVVNQTAEVVSDEASVGATLEVESVDITGKSSQRLPTAVSAESLFSPGWVWDVDEPTFVPPLSMSSDRRQSSRPFNVVDAHGSGVCVVLKGGETLTVSRGYIFDVYRRVTDEIDEREAERLESGDVLILIDDSQHVRLFDRIVEALEMSHPDYASLGVWLSIWELAKTSALSSCNASYTCLYQRLVDMGASISEGAVRSWFIGTMGPQDEENVYRLIEISGDKAAITHKVQVRTALGHIRGMRRKYGRLIRALVRQAAVTDQPEQLLGDTLNIAIEDVLAAAKLVAVERVELINGC